MSETFGKAIAKLRKEKGMTQKELADLLGVSDKAVSRWENDKNYPDIETLRRISTTFRVSIDELLQGNIKIVPKKSPAKKILVITAIIIVLAYMFPVYNWQRVTSYNYFGAQEASYLMFRGWPTEYSQIQPIIDTAEEAFSQVGISKADAEETYEALGRYCITDDYENVTTEKHKLKVLSVRLDQYTSEYKGYIWVRYDREGLTVDGKTEMGSWDVEALWCLEKDEIDNWYVAEVKEMP